MVMYRLIGIAVVAYRSIGFVVGRCRLIGIVVLIDCISGRTISIDWGYGMPYSLISTDSIAGAWPSLLRRQAATFRGLLGSRPIDTYRSILIID